jgi:glycosyltransferase involved in cell wall biosynthesis
MQQRIAFISTMGGAAWGGSEELWSQTALRLAAEGFRVFASLGAWSPPHPRVLHLVQRGIDVSFRPARYPLWNKAWRALAKPSKTRIGLEIERILAATGPRLVVFSDGGPFPPIEVLEICYARQLPFVTIGQANWESWWPDDILAERYRTAAAVARRCYFVSKGNLRLVEKQIGCELPNAEVVWNPYNFEFDASLPWPPMGQGGALQFACVARLEPHVKGQDILLEVLAAPTWSSRQWQLHLYGEGPKRDGLKRLAHRLGLSDRVAFEGHVPVDKIWSSNHALVMPSRIEGLPLTIIEAMLCGRPIVATDVAGNAEVIDDGVTGFLAEAPTVGSVANALERFWTRRGDAEEIGAAGAKRIRQLVPSDPAQVFTDKIKQILAHAG